MRRRTVAVLIGGRAAFRLAQYSSAFFLLAIWGSADFARYAGAVGLASWLFAITAAGVERAALLSVGAGERRRLESLFVRMAVLPYALALPCWLVALLAAPHSHLGTDLSAAVLATGGGLATVLAGLCRVRGRYLPDAAAFVTLSGAYIAVVAVAAGTDLGPDGLLGLLVLAVTLIDATLLAVLWPGMPRRIGLRRADVTAALRMSSTLAAGEVLALVAIAVLYAELTPGPARQTSAFYLCNIVGSTVIGIWPYLLRLAQPRISRWVTDHPQNARARTRRAVWLTVLPGAVLSVAGIIAVIVFGSTTPLIVLALLAEMLVLVAVATAAFVLEAIDRQTRDTSALGALVGMIVIAGSGAALIPVGGAAGALVALCIGWTVRCPFLLFAARRALPAGAPDPLTEITPVPQ